MYKDSRTELLIGSSALQKLKNSSVAVFGLGGVGGFVVEGLARSGVGNLTLIDSDALSPSNLNRQIIATTKTLGLNKTTAMADRVKDIDSDIKVTKIDAFITADNISQINFSNFDYVVDAVDTVTAKIGVILECKKANVPVISCMGTGGKLDPTFLEVTDIFKTEFCPLARVMRRELKARGVTNLKVVYSKEQGVKPVIGNDTDKKADGKAAPPSMIFVPASAGLMIASQVVMDLIEGENK
ncbi:MAG: tRNA threonylcarbamoyladenosine dehydratase [Clostridiales bacterium]|nr:tRNA threonylcarbamoyladenosine dehydratase [Clostridiales bacterium]